MTLEPDRGLLLRMAATVFLFITFLLVSTVASIGLAVGLVSVLAFVTGASTVEVVVIVLLTASFGGVSIHLLRRYDSGVEWTEYDEPESIEVETPLPVSDRLTRLANQASCQVPKIRMIDSPVPNAYTVGYRPGTATIVLTTALLDQLSENELDAVIAHELAHIAHRDVPIMTVIGAPIAAGERLHAWADETLGTATERDNNALLGVLLVNCFALSWIFVTTGRLLVRALSRYREFAADRGAVAILGSPADLASALTRLSGTAQPDDDLRKAGGLARAFAIVPAKREAVMLGPDGERARSSLFIWFDRWLATHPSTADRIDQLGELQRAQSRRNAKE